MLIKKVGSDREAFGFLVDKFALELVLKLFLILFEETTTDVEIVSDVIDELVLSGLYDLLVLLQVFRDLLGMGIMDRLLLVLDLPIDDVLPACMSLEHLCLRVQTKIVLSVLEGLFAIYGIFILGPGCRLGPV